MKSGASLRRQGPAAGCLEQRLEREVHVWLLLLAVAAFALVRAAPNDYTASDPAGSLLLSQALLEHGSFHLDSYIESPVLQSSAHTLWLESSEHAHYYWPPGPSILALPVVWLANLRGEDMADSEDNRQLQRLLAAVIVAFTVPLGYALARLYLPRVASLALAALFVFASPVASVLGVALWNLNFTFFLYLICLLLVARDERGRGRLSGFAVGLLLGAALLCRPTAALLAAPLLLYLLLWRRRQFVPALAGVLVVAAGLVAFSLVEHSRLLPAYYRPSRLEGSSFGAALYGHLLSPSRGLLVFNPYLILFLAAAVAGWRRLARRPIVWLVATWLGLHLFAVAAFPHWWGGHSYGNRLFADAYAGLMLLMVLVVEATAGSRFDLARGVPSRALFACAGLALFIHSYQGLYNPYIQLWNLARDRADTHFDWSRAQFLANPRMLAPVIAAAPLGGGPPLHFGESIGPASTQAVFAGFGGLEGGGGWRWTADTEANLYCLLAQSEIGDLATVVLELRAGTFGRQRIGVSINGHELGTLTGDGVAVENFTFDVPTPVLSRHGDLQGGLVVAVHFSVPQALSPASLSADGSGDPRRLGLFFKRLRFLPGHPDES